SSFTACTPPALLPSFFFFNDTATTEISTLSLHDALPICRGARPAGGVVLSGAVRRPPTGGGGTATHRRGAASPGPRLIVQLHQRSEEHTSELQSLTNLVCRLLLEKKKKKNSNTLLSLRTA